MSSVPLSGSERAAQREKALIELGRGDVTSAYQLFKSVVDVDTEDSIAWLGLGECLEKMSSMKSAMHAYGQARRVDPNSYLAAHGLGRMLIALGHFKTAVNVLKDSVAHSPGSEAAWCDLGTALTNLKQYSDAEHSFQKAISLNPKYALSYLNLGTNFRERGAPEDAIGNYRKSLSLDPDSVHAATSLAATLSDVGDMDTAIEVVDQYLEHHPNDIEAHQNKALFLLRGGKLGAGFEEYEWRLRPSRFGIPIRPFQYPTWRGDKLKNRSLLIWLEQGIGDEILSLSIWNSFLHSDEGHRCIIESDLRLTDLIKRSFPFVTVVDRQTPPDYKTEKANLTCPAWSGARFLGVPPIYTSDKRHYLVADSAASSALRKKYERLAQGKAIVGLSWSSDARKGHLKTPPISSWDILMQDEDCFFVSLQHAPSEDDVTHLSEMSGGRFHIDTPAEAPVSFDDHASEISALDAIITISNSTAHLAGALGTPVATVVPSGYGGFWYWFRGRSDSPWYPSMRICRQPGPGVWPPAISSAHVWLKEILQTAQHLS
ncbi:MAG: tetratricopeptide repeat protein [Rhodospirillaceae bacterium]|jgi:tetratricopeptide (TPR) repeat protein|nr:tetratricopeptide repeat protein [Rhodospirillaceae bacterium]MBT5566283.1 tetratricopeptide repeat protein [Rhodospirillaceae bacterium]MBT6088061.1 tetratricopeptide repeat protein [Rhodospirillaceae bacterium]MBT7451783.1 tetratricopeptide repeat protein [Rhodospirillaceae bacterium]